MNGEGLEFEDYLIRTNDDHLLILGGSPRWCCMAFTTCWSGWSALVGAGRETVPVRLLLDIEPIDIDVRPPLIYRATWYRNAMNADWQARNRLDAGTMGIAAGAARRHGAFRRRRAGHTYDGLVPTAKYFDEHRSITAR